VKKIWERIEKMIFPKLQHIITVNDSIAAIFKAKYNKELVVVRNIGEQIIQTNIKSKEELGLPADKKIIIIQGSGLNIERGIEEAIEAMLSVRDAVLVIIGDGDVIPSAKIIVEKYELSTKVMFFGKRPYSELMQFTHYADIGLALDKPKSLNYKYALPNKLFDYINTQTAVVSSNLIEIEKIVKHYEIGCVIEQTEPKLIAAAINSLIDNPELLATYKNNCKAAAKIENWENEKVKLKALLDQVVAN
jgi:glycosyltransferase involved in cell wall biosynthesis